MIKRIFATDVIRAAPARWADQYKGPHNTADKHAITQKLNALVWPFTKEQVDDIIGNPSWTEISCDECCLVQDSLVRIGEEPDYDARWMDVCNACLEKARAS